jgi:hypothetical protein
VSWTTAVKFLVARKFDVARAVSLFEQNEAIRRAEGLMNFDPTKEPLKSELKTGKFTILVSFIGLNHPHFFVTIDSTGNSTSIDINVNQQSVNYVWTCFLF